MLWWTVWGGTLVGLAAVYVVLALVPDSLWAGGSLQGFALLALVPLAGSAVVRWLLLPRARGPQAAFVLYVLGLALAEACGIVGAVCGGPAWRDGLLLLALLGVAQFVPLFSGAGAWGAGRR